MSAVELFLSCNSLPLSCFLIAIHNSIIMISIISMIIIISIISSISIIIIVRFDALLVAITQLLCSLPNCD